jgi:hypothetical protein
LSNTPLIFIPWSYFSFRTAAIFLLVNANAKKSIDSNNIYPMGYVSLAEALYIKND